MIAASANVFRGVAVVGLPLVVDGQLFNSAAVIHAGKLLGVVPKIVPAELQGVLRRPLVRPGRERRVQPRRRLAGARRPVRHRPALRLRATSPGFVVGVEICEDLWVPVPPSSLAGPRRGDGAGQPVGQQRGDRQGGLPPATGRRASRAAASPATSTPRAASANRPPTSSSAATASSPRTASLLAESRALPPRRAPDSSPTSTSTACAHDRIQTNSFGDAATCVGRPRVPPRRRSTSNRAAPTPTLLRDGGRAPVRAAATRRSCDERCEEIFHTQVAGLARAAGAHRQAAGRHRRLRRARLDAGAAGRLQDDRRPRRAARRASRRFTMPGFGTTARTRRNARALMQQLGVSAREMRHPRRSASTR